MGSSSGLMRQSLGQALHVLICSFCLHAVSSVAAGQNNNTVITPGAGAECTNFNLLLAPNDVHFYTCCSDFMDVESGDVMSWDCNPPRLHEAPTTVMSNFDCGGASGIALAKQTCDKRWLSSENCFHWSECFEGACLHENGGPSGVDFCGDGKCSPQESTHSCAADCCPMANDRCLISGNTCPSPCCNEQTCCREEVQDPFADLVCPKAWWLGLFFGGLGLLNFFTCCCISSGKRCKTQYY